MSFINDLEDIWEQVKIDLSESISPSIMDLWFGPIKIHDYEENTIIFATESEFNYKVFAEKYIPILKKAFSKHFGFEQEIKVIFTGIPSSTERIKEQLGLNKKPAEEIEDEEEVKSGDSASAVAGVLPIDYSFQYTFDNFIVGSSNKFAHAACTAVAANPAKNYNPLFIYGPSGVGKTHLMYAVINEIKQKRPASRVIYTMAVDFVNHMVKCMTNSDMESFRNYYLNCDVLLIDDVQFIAGKVSTQMEVFHTFTTLFNAGKQIILASDKPPKDINPLEERLRGRFEQGLLADINPPDLELRVAIIKKKAEDMDIDLPDEVLSFLAENLRSNIRQIEGSIKKLAAKSLVEGRRISMELAKDCIHVLLGDAEPLNVTIDKIFAAIFKKYNVSKEDLVGQKRNKEIATARHVAIYLLREVTEISFPNIGKVIGKDPSTVQTSYKLVKNRLIREPLFAADIEALQKDITCR